MNWCWHIFCNLEGYLTSATNIVVILIVFAEHDCNLHKSVSSCKDINKVVVENARNQNKSHLKTNVTS